MILQEDINREFDLAKKIYIHYLDKLASYISVGSDLYLQWYKDLCILYYLTEQLQAIIIVDDELTIGGVVIDDDDFNLIISHIREFITNDIRRTVYADLDTSGNIKDYSSPSVPPLIVTYQSVNSSDQTIYITIETDDITQLTLPFNIDDVSPESVVVTVNDNDPLYNVTPEVEGFHVEGNTLFWHTYYNLKIGDVMRIQYTLIG